MFNRVVGKFLLRPSIVFLMMATLTSGCAAFGVDSGYRSLTITNHQFDSPTVSVSRDTPFVLTINAIDDRDFFISAPELGFHSIRVPSSPISGNILIKDRVLPSRYARLPLGPLQPGRYLISCDCHGHQSKSVVVVD